jgi:Bacterial RNA polymerase, alpha chain C terminal domain
MSNTPFRAWKDGALEARAVWVLQAEAELNQYLAQLLAGEEISDRGFIAVLHIYFHMCGVEISRFASMAGIDGVLMWKWYHSKEVPPVNFRVPTIMLFKAATEFLPLSERIYNLLSAPIRLPDVFFAIGDTAPVEVQSDERQLQSSIQEVELGHIFAMEIAEMSFSVRSQGCLRNESIQYVGQLVSYTEAQLLRTPNFGRKSLNEIKEVLSFHGVRLGMEVEHYPGLAKFLEEHPLLKSRE